MVKLIDELKGHKPIRPFPKDLIDEDSSSNSRSSVKEEIPEQKPEQQPPPEEYNYSIDNSSANDEFPLKQTIRLVKKTDVKEDTGSEQKTEPEEEKSEQSPEKVTAQKKRRRK